MSEKYDEYLKMHCDNVYTAFIWLVNNVPDILIEVTKMIQMNLKH